MNMYVSNLSYNTGESELMELFSAFGTVSAVKIITDRETGRSRGFGFVEMPTKSEAEMAMSSLDRKDIEGRSLSVTEARPKSESDRSRNNRW